MVFDLSLEKNIISSSINWISYDTFINHKILVENCTEKDFYQPVLKKIFGAIKKCVEKDAFPLPMTVEAMGLDKNAVDFMYTELQNTATMLDIKPTIPRLKIITKSRQLAQNGSGLTTLFNNNLSNIEQVYEKTEKKVTEIINSVYTTDEGYYLKDKLGEYFEGFEEDMKRDNKIIGFSSGIDKLDEITGGFRPGELVVVAGRPGMGKSSFALTGFSKALLRNEKPAMWSLEMQRKEIYNKMFSMISKINNPSSVLPYQWLRNPTALPKRLNKMYEIATQVHDSNAYINNNPYTPFQQIRTKARELKYSTGIDVLIIDHLGLLVTDYDHEAQQIGEFAVNLKNLAMELEIPVIVLHQLNRDAEKAGIPSMRHLYNCGKLEMAADIILFPWRPFAFDKTQDPSESLLILGKGRNVTSPNINLNFCTETTLFEYIKKDDISHPDF